MTPQVRTVDSRSSKKATRRGTTLCDTILDMTMPDRASEVRLQEEFNRWAEEGRGEGMEEHHLPIVEPTLALMDLQPADCVLDVGCGSGWLVRRLAASVAGRSRPDRAGSELA